MPYDPINQTWTLPGTGDTSGMDWALSGLAKAYDWIIDRPIRTGISQVLRGRAPYNIRHDPMPPTWENIAESFGITGKTLNEISPRFSGSASNIPLSSLAGIGMSALFDPLPGGEIKGMRAASKATPAALPKGMHAAAGKKVFHGSPHRFEKFDISKIGTGEGATAFGHGLYFTDEKAIAKEYAENLGKRADEALLGGEKVRELSEKTGNQVYAWLDDWHERGLTKQEMVEQLEKNIADKEWSEKFGLTSKQKEVLKELKKSELKGTGQKKHLYTARIPEGDYLKWDEPISKSKAEKIKSQMNKEGIVGEDVKNELLGYTGQDFYNAFTGVFKSKQEASKFLNRAGIQGIDYPAGSLSGVKGSKARNYVVFSDEGISIEDIKKLMLLGAGAGVGVGAMNQ